MNDVTPNAGNFGGADGAGSGRAGGAGGAGRDVAADPDRSFPDAADGPGPAEFNSVACATLVRELEMLGVQWAIVAPGSRSAPLAVALARASSITTIVALDERAAAFRALGIGMATGTPAIVLCTSGTAGTHFHAAVVEACHARVPMIVCTADRPPELQGIGAPQTIDQQELFGPAALQYFAPPPPDEHRDLVRAAALWRDLGDHAFAIATGTPHGPVHLNLAFREPLLTMNNIVVDDAAVAAIARTDAVPRNRPVPSVATTEAAASAAEIGALVRDARRGLLVLGWGARVDSAVVQRFARATGWPVLADTISGLRDHEGVISHYEALLRCQGWADAHRPDLVVRIGAAPTSKTLTQWLDDSIPQTLIDPDGIWLDPQRSAAKRFHCDPNDALEAFASYANAIEPTAARDEWQRDWRSADSLANAAITGVVDHNETLNEPLIVRDLVRGIRDGTNVLVASSMPVRDAEWFCEPRGGVRFFANRGANGIDGLISTAAGVALGTGAPTVALLGDLALLHDAGGLLNIKALGITLTLVVVDNGGGGIFSFLAQAEICPPHEFELLFGTPQNIDVADVVKGYGISVIEVDRAAALIEAVNRSLAVGGVRVVLVRTERSANVELHHRIWRAVDDALTKG